MFRCLDVKMLRYALVYAIFFFWDDATKAATKLQTTRKKFEKFTSSSFRILL